MKESGKAEAARAYRTLVAVALFSMIWASALPAQRFMPVAFTRPLTSELLSQQRALVATRSPADSAAQPGQSAHILVGALLGAAGGAVLGYALAQVGHRAYCEGSTCGNTPARGIQTTMTVGLIVGLGTGALIGYATSAP